MDLDLTIFPVIDKLNKEFEVAQNQIIKLEKQIKQQQEQINALIKESHVELYQETTMPNGMLSVQVKLKKAVQILFNREMCIHELTTHHTN